MWNKEYLVENAYGECIELDGNENVYIAGGIYGDADATGLLLKYDKEGNLLWDKDYDFLEKLEFSGMAIDAEGYVYVTGNYRMPGKTRDIMTCKISPQGDTLWTKIRIQLSRLDGWNCCRQHRRRLYSDNVTGYSYVEPYHAHNQVPAGNFGERGPQRRTLIF